MLEEAMASSHAAQDCLEGKTVDELLLRLFIISLFICSVNTFIIRIKS